MNTCVDRFVSRIRQLEEEFASEHEAQRRHTTSPSPVAGGVKACGIVTDRRRRHGDAGIHTKAGRGMTPRSVLRTSLRWSAAGAWLAAAGYAAYVGVTWARYGHVAAPNPDEHDELLDRFMPGYDVVERHHIRVAAPAAATLAAAQDMILLDLPVVRAVFKGRALILGAAPDQRPRRGLLADSQSLGWVVLAETPGQEIVVGAVTKPWEANVTFRSLPGEAFKAFCEPDFVKIVWNLRADAISSTTSVFRTETRALATDASARTKFRRYWSFLSPGIFLIRRMMLGPLKAEAERRGHQGAGVTKSREKSSVSGGHGRGSQEDP
jgi:hypothetical protein